MIKNKLLFLVTLYVFLRNTHKIQAYRDFDVDGVHTILALENEDIGIICVTGVPMAYCGFIHPSGKRFSFSGFSLADGHCAVKIRATRNDSGNWKCHIGKRTIGLEMVQDIQVRVVGEVVALQPRMTAVHGKDVTLVCVTTREKIPLRYCRFEPPSGVPFSIDSAVKPSKPILGKYFYPQNMSLDRGDCAVTIRKVKYSDVGSWTCGVGLDDGDGKEHTDVIRLEVEGLYTMVTASTTGITFGTIGILIFLAILGVLAWKKRRVMGAGRREPEVIDISELGPRPQSPGSQRSQRSHRSERSVSPHRGRSVPAISVQSPSGGGTSPMLM